MTTEARALRERVAAAMAHRAGSRAFKESGREWEHLRSEWLRHADTALAVTEQERARLQADLDLMRVQAQALADELAGKRRELSPDGLRELGEARTEVRRLTIELAEVRAQAAAMFTNATSALEEAERRRYAAEQRAEKAEAARRAVVRQRDPLEHQVGMVRDLLKHWQDRPWALQNPAPDLYAAVRLPLPDAEVTP